MHSSVVSSLYWNYWAAVVYILAMFGYLTIDTINYLFRSFDDGLCRFIYVVLAILFVLDAILYTISWYTHAVKSRENKDEPIGYRVEFVACIFQHLGSYLYLIGTLLSFHDAEIMQTALLLHFIGIMAFLIESGFTFAAWRISFRGMPSTNPKRGCVSQDVYMWAHIMNTVGSLIYLCATALSYRLYTNLKVIYPNAVLILFMLGDLVYLFDAYLYYECCQRDKQDYDANTERQKIIKLNLVKQLTTESLPADENK